MQGRPFQEFVLVAGGGTPRSFGRAREERALRVAILIWILSLLVCAGLAWLSFVYFDVPVATHVYGLLTSTGSLGTGFASDVLLGVEAAVVLALVITRIIRGHLSPFREAVVLACLASICAYAINDGTLKFVFGVPNPIAVLNGGRHAFHLFKGAPNCGFPSGHMVLAGAFAGVFMRLYRVSIVPLAALLLIAAVLLVVGDWHFVSDVLVGTFIGVSAGVLAGELWLAHVYWVRSAD